MRAILVLLLLVASVLPVSAAGPAEPVVIGVVYNLTGAMASLDAPGYEGMKLAVARINKRGGVLGRPVVLEVRDAGSDVERCRDAAGELAGLKVAAVAGLNDSDYALVAGEAVTKKRVPFLAAGATLPTLPRMLGPYYFMTCFGDDAQGKALAKFALRRQGVDSMLVLTDRDLTFTTALSGYFIKGFTTRGGAVAARLGFSSGQAPPGLAEAARSCAAAGTCKGVFVSGSPEDAQPLVKAVRAAGFAGPVFSGDGFDTPLLSGVADQAGPGIFFSTHVSYDSPRRQVREFVEAWTAAYGSAPASGFAALGYDTVGLIADAVRRAKTSDPQAVRRALAATRAYPGVTGDIGYPEALCPPLKPVAVMRFQGGKRAFEAEVLP
ncbi:ABC transporter substrate-binding protein [Fundidesulfovibrio terrae]|uniref:ABC transporter substrate-binding protein n=1 Tax=Fundidesulfovibrio terrae TaxID=2922866 RepID=UPI001FB01C96